MALLKLNKNPSRRDLAWFGVLFAVFLGLAGLISYVRSGLEGAAPVIWTIAAAVPAVYYAVPPLRRPIYLGWIYLVSPIGFVLSYVVLACAYYLVFTPVALVLRLVGHDPLERKLEPARSTYWVEHRAVRDPNRYFSQF